MATRAAVRSSYWIAAPSFISAATPVPQQGQADVFEGKYASLYKRSAPKGIDGGDECYVPKAVASQMVATLVRRSPTSADVVGHWHYFGVDLATLP